MNSRTLAIVAIVTAGGLASANAISQGKAPGIRIGVGVVLGGLGLTFLSDVAPQVGAAMSALVIVSAVLTQGPAFYQTIGKAFA